MNVNGHQDLDAKMAAILAQPPDFFKHVKIPDVEFRVLVTGSRDWSDAAPIYIELFEVLGEHPRLVVVHGACPTGADSIADVWARNRGPYVRPEPHPADWEQYGKPAGPRRNQEMVDAGADLCLAFLMPASKGTRHCASAAEKALIPTRRFWGV